MIEEYFMVNTRDSIYYISYIAGFSDKSLITIFINDTSTLQIYDPSLISFLFFV